MLSQWERQEQSKKTMEIELQYSIFKAMEIQQLLVKEQPMKLSVFANFQTMTLEEQFILSQTTMLGSPQQAKTQDRVDMQVESAMGLKYQ